MPAQARPTDHEYHHLKGFFPQWQKLQEINTSDPPDLQLPGRPRHGPGHRAVPGGTMGRNLRHGPARPSCRASTAQLFSCWAGLRAQVFGPCSCQPIKHGPDLQLYLRHCSGNTCKGSRHQLPPSDGDTESHQLNACSSRADKFRIIYGLGATSSLGKKKLLQPNWSGDFCQLKKGYLLHEIPVSGQQNPHCFGQPPNGSQFFPRLKSMDS